jgi:hypothetical protein
VSRDLRDDIIIDVGERGIEFESDLIDEAMMVMRMKLMI